MGNLSERALLTESQESIQTKVSSSVKVLGILLFLFGLWEYFCAFIPFLIFLIFERAVSSGLENSVPGYIFRVIPYAPLLLIPLTVLPFMIIFSAVRLFDGSNRSLKQSVFSVITVPPTIFLLSLLFLKLVFGGFGVDSFANFFGPNVSIWVVSNFVVELLPAVILLTLLVFLKSKFTFSVQPLSGTAKMLLVIILLVTILPVTFYVGSGMIAAADKDLERSQAQKQVEFRIHLPSKLPADYEQITKVTYGISDEAWEGGIKVVYSQTPSSSINAEAIKSPIALRERGVDSEFNLEQYMKENFFDKKPEETKLDLVDIESAKTGKGYAGEFGILYLYSFVTPDNVLVEILSPKKKSSLSNLQIIADSLD